MNSLGQTISGREIDCVTVGTGPRTCYIIHRQHPGESMAEFYAEGLLNRLLGLDDKWDKVCGVNSAFCLTFFLFLLDGSMVQPS